ncbi:MAG: micrococcal nuclease [Clostridia bacterium]|nr:micrococcal nuclease [Clostridia bacterium]
MKGFPRTGRTTTIMVRIFTHLLLILILSLSLLTGCGTSPVGSSSVGTPGTAADETPATPTQAAEVGKPASSPPDAQSKAEAQDKAKEAVTESAVKTLPAAVTSVVDGDTVYARLQNGKEEKVRFIGVDTPESTREVEPYGKEAAVYTKKRLDGKKVYLELDVGERDKYGRLLAYVWLEQPKDNSEAEVRAKMFNAELLLNGYAQVMTVPPNVKYADLMAKLQQEAREAGKGLWGAAVTAPAPAPAPGGKSSSAAK